MIKIRDLNFVYEKSNFELSVSKIDVNTGEKIVFTGPSGCGKTTLMNLISGILLPKSGDIEITDINIAKMNDSQRRNFRIQNIGFIFQTFELIDYLNILDNITLPLRISKSLKLTDEVIEKAKLLAKDVGLEKNLDISISNLSHGEKQRVAICRALINDPEYIIADEPTGNLDYTNKEKAMDIIMNEVTRHKSTLLMVTHDESLISRFDRKIDFHSLLRVS